MAQQLTQQQYAQKIQQSRAAGYSNQDIVSFLAKSDPGSAQKIQQSVQAGYSPDDIVAHLSGDMSVGSPSSQQAENPTMATQPSLLQKAGTFIAPLSTGISQALAAPSSNPVLNFLSGGTSGTNQSYQDRLDQNHQIDQQILKQVQAAEAVGNTAKVEKLLSILNIGQNTPKPTTQDIATNGQGYQTAEQTVGDALTTGLNALSGGMLKLPVSGGASLASKVPPGAVQNILKVVGSPTAGRITQQAVGGGLYGAAGALQENKSSQDVLNALRSGASVASILSGGIEGISALKNLGRSALGKTAAGQVFGNPSKDVMAGIMGKSGASNPASDYNTLLSQADEAAGKAAPAGQRPASELMLENAVNSGNLQEARNIVESLPKDSPYYASNKSLLDTMGAPKKATEKVLIPGNGIEGSPITKSVQTALGGTVDENGRIVGGGFNIGGSGPAGLFSVHPEDQAVMRSIMDFAEGKSSFPSGKVAAQELQRAKDLATAYGLDVKQPGSSLSNKITNGISNAFSVRKYQNGEIISPTDASRALADAFKPVLENGGHLPLNFSNSVLANAPEKQAAINTLWQDIGKNTVGANSTGGSNTLKNLDTLKQRIDAKFTNNPATKEERTMNAILTSMKKAVQQPLESASPKYRQAMQAAQGGIAGSKFSSLLPQGRLAQLEGEGAGLLALLHPAAIPAIATGAVAASPRVQGLVLRGAGAANRAAGKATVPLANATRNSPVAIAAALKALGI